MHMWLMRRTSLATRLGLSNAEVAGYAGNPKPLRILSRHSIMARGVGFPWLSGQAAEIAFTALTCEVSKILRRTLVKDAKRRI